MISSEETRSALNRFSFSSERLLPSIYPEKVNGHPIYFFAEFATVSPTRRLESDSC